MSLPIIVFSLALGATAGILYGLLFITQKKFSVPEQASRSYIWRYRAHALLMTALRIILLSLLLVLGWHSLLRSETIPFILIFVSFFAGFWFLILKKKV